MKLIRGMSIVEGVIIRWSENPYQKLNYYWLNYGVAVIDQVEMILWGFYGFFFSLFNGELTDWLTVYELFLFGMLNGIPIKNVNSIQLVWAHSNRPWCRLCIYRERVGVHICVYQKRDVYFITIALWKWFPLKCLIKD